MGLLERFGTDEAIVGMVHLPPLPGAPDFEGDRDAVRDAALRDARALVEGDVDAVLVENFGDAPFYPDDVPTHVVAEMTAVVERLRDELPASVPVGVNVLRNDVPAALSIAAATGGEFVRANVHTGARVTDQGLVEGRAHETVRLRERLAPDPEVAILADLDVKHSAPLGGDALDRETVADAVERGKADGLIVSGAATGDAVDVDRLATVAEWRDDVDPDVPLLVGSGVTADAVADLLSVADGAIVGTALKDGDDVSNPVDPDAVADLVAASRDDR